MKKIGTHNSMTYLKPYKWYMYPFKFIAKCQSVSIEKQYELGARMFDIRVSFDKYGLPEFRHGHMVFEGDVYKTLDFLNKKGVYVRLLLEVNKYDKVKEEHFIDFCHLCEEYWTNIKFFCGRRKYDWKQLYKFELDDIDVVQKVSSMTGTILDDWCPWFYARIMNKRNIREHKDNRWLLIDFINIQ